MQRDLWHVQYSLHKSILIENVRGRKKIRRACWFSFYPGRGDSVASGQNKSGEHFTFERHVRMHFYRQRDLYAWGKLEALGSYRFFFHKMHQP